VEGRDPLESNVPELKPVWIVNVHLQVVVYPIAKDMGECEYPEYNPEYCKRLSTDWSEKWLCQRDVGFR
jgi:hypothetical protein